MNIRNPHTRRAPMTAPPMYSSPGARPPALERFTEGRPVLDPLGLGVDGGEPDVDILGPVRDQTPA
jgi:hypothetical protein